MGANAATQAAECLEKTVETMRLLARHGEDPTQHFLLTGATMREHARRLLGLRCVPGGSWVLLQDGKLYVQLLSACRVSLCFAITAGQQSTDQSTRTSWVSDAQALLCVRMA
jgi:hypothetical protein